MRRRAIGAAFAVAALLAADAGGVAAAAQPATRTARIGYLTGGSIAARTGWLAAFRHELAALGLRDGAGTTIATEGADGRFDRLPALAEALLATRPDVLVVSTTPAALAAKAATRTVPIVFVGVADPIGDGLVANLARPGGNITGLTNSTAELSGKRLEILAELVPGARRVALLVNPDDANATGQMRSVEAAGAARGIEIGPILAVRGASDLEPAFRAAAAGDAAAALRLVDPLGSMLREATQALAARYRIPVVYAFREDVVAGGLASYGASQEHLYRRAAAFVQRILAGTPAGELPVEQPTRFELVVNLATARALALAVPPTILARADEVIE